MKKFLVPVMLIFVSLSSLVLAESADIKLYSQAINPHKTEYYKVYSLGEVVVSCPATGVESVGTSTRITTIDIKTSGARTLNEALDLIPGIYVRIGGSGTPRIDIRGFRTRHVTLLLDGIPFNNTFDGQFDPTTIPVENIAEIKVVTGGGSVLYGTGGNGGIINVITKKGIKGVRGSVSGEAGSENSRGGKFSFSWVGEKLDTFISGSMSEKDGFPLSDDFNETKSENGGLRENSDYERKNVFATFGYSPNQNSLIGLSYNHLQGENGIPGRINYDKNNPFTKKPKYDRIDDLEGNALQLALDHKTAGPLRVRGWAYFNQQDMLENRYDDDGSYTLQTQKGTYSSDSTSRIYGANLQLAYEFSRRGTATLGIITETHKWKADGFETNKKGGRDPIDMNEDYKVHSFAVEYGVSPVDRLDLVLGYGYHLMKKDAGGDEKDDSYLLGAAFDLTENTRLKASIAKKIRFPSIRQLYDVDSGNVNLEAEKTFHYEFGIRYTLFYNTDLSLTAFRIKAEDFIEKEEGIPYQNYEEYLFKGLEFAADSRPTDNFHIRLAYSLLDSEDESKNSEKDELQHRPKNKYSVEMTYSFGFGLTVHGDVLRFTDIYFYDSDNTPPLLKKDLNDYTLVNLKLSQRFLKNALEAYIGADNLLDKDYEQSYGLPHAGKTVYGGMTYRF